VRAVEKDSRVLTHVSTSSELVLLERDPLRVEIALRPFAITVRRAGRRLLRAGGAWVADGTIHDHFVQFTEGVVAREELSPRERALRADVLERSRNGVALALALQGGRRATLDVRIVGADRIALELDAEDRPLRLALDWDRRSEERFVGLGARHGTQFDQAGRAVQLGADRRYTGPDCPPDMLAAGGIPQGDCAPVPWLLSSRGYGAWIQTDANGTRIDLAGERVSVSTRASAGPLRVELLCAGTSAARLRAFCRLTGFPALLPEWG
jgi:alpha-D-xyloside xylohydrolase